MRAHLPSLLLVATIVMSATWGCGSSSKNAVAEERQQAAEQGALAQRAEFQKRCGNPVRFPISDECVRMAGDQGPELRRRSDLTMAVWRSCALTPSSAESIRQELIAKGTAKTPIGQKMIGEMERTEQHSDSPCVMADLHDLDCVAGSAEACETARNNDPACVAWLNDQDTQERLHCIDRAVHDQACMAKAPASDNDVDSGAANAFSDAPEEEEDCRRMETACLHTFDECANAKDALQRALKPQKSPARQ
jgi:hypothetical protein